MKEIDARGLDCPKPVVLTKKAMADNEEVLVIVDNKIASENVAKLAQKMKAEVSIVEESADYFKIIIKNTGEKVKSENNKAAVSHPSEAGKVYLIASDKLGEGEEDLGKILIKGFLSTLLDIKPLPEKVIFLNSGVKMAVLEKDVTATLEKLESAGVEVLICGTCLDYYDLSDQLEVGEVSNMYEIVNSINSSDYVRV
ncbi:selenium metabolism protein YedF [Halanaerobium saccharolyticum]|uniref:Selenium metabolism protein YedF n=1 Tax=Halanaerobium saccharolyticum TaxID=43595 RepID=A0A4R7Z338_9FIRM|nr:sulfurtransferase-like selenium metabolism protein YedF [Halanaerobium saccharolyticum]RAK08493.1 selenium metabolism protein YedF [Halanaerobium saccharolyticum]TDW03472.1 selenium metabolism protein YedF [Halanaerobium saccharolyticum]TDX59985.1 selenium metabolism protein YedF [Halanaerobium saccharolyticum]